MLVSIDIYEHQFKHIQELHNEENNFVDGIYNVP